MGAIQDKGHISIDGYLFMLARQIRSERHIYGREEAPHFVNKFSSGDPNYRDSTFFPHWVQNNWLNGFEQEKFNDGGRFYRSSRLDPTTQEKLMLQKATESIGAVTGNVTAFGVRSASAIRWFNDNYGYRQQLTVTAAGAKAAPIGFPVKVTVDTAALQTASKVLANRNDWRVVYDNGSTFVDLSRDYISATSTIFALQAAIASGQTDSNYYLYYGYAGESTNKQPTTEAQWNAVYAMFGATPDDNSVLIAHFKEGTSTSIEDSSAQTNTGTYTNPDWGLDGSQGRYGKFNADTNHRRVNFGSGGSLNLGSFTYEALVTPTASQPANQGEVFRKRRSDDADYAISAGIQEDGRMYITIHSQIHLTSATGVFTNGTEYHLAWTSDGSSYVKMWINGVEVASGSLSGVPDTSGMPLLVGASSTSTGGFRGNISHVRVSNIPRTSFPYGLSAADRPTNSPGVETAKAAIPTGGTFEVYAGTDEGKMWLWDGDETWTEAFDARKIMYHDTVANADGSYIIGDDGGTERAQAQSFTLVADTSIKALSMYLKKVDGTPGDITVRIETDSSNAPSGTLAHANATATIPAFTTTSYAWVTAEFAAVTGVLTQGTKYWIVLETAAAANDNNYEWASDASSPSFTAGTSAHSADGGSTYSAGTEDFLFRILGAATQINAIAQATFVGTTKLYIATGDPDNGENNNARIYTYNGSLWELFKTFTGAGSSAALCLQVYESKLYVGLAPTAKIEAYDGTTWATSKDIDQPDNPGYVWDMEVYAGRLYAGGGHPEFVKSNNSQGFLFSFDNFSWTLVYDFAFTVIRSLRAFDNLLFIGTINKRLYVYNTASVDKLLEFPWEVAITTMEVYDDKLAIGLSGINSLTGHEAIYLFDRNGFHEAWTPAAQNVNALLTTRNQLLMGLSSSTIYKASATNYTSSGTLQTSYFEAALPSIDKKWRSLILHFEALPVGTSILAQYKTDEADASWVTIGTADTAGSTFEEFFFDDAFYSKKISILFTVTTSDPLVTPKIKIMDIKYVLYPDFKYLWKMTLAMPDNLVWLDGTEPITTTTEAITAGETAVTMTDTSGFPTKGRAVIIDNGVEDEFTWTGNTGTELTGIPATGDLALAAHADTGLTVKMTGGTFHRTILALKQQKALNDFVDIDGITYDVLFHGYQEDGFTVNQESGLENHVPITLLEV